MSTATYADRTALTAADTSESRPARKPLLSRLYKAFVASRQRRAEREIARFLASRGPLTDEVEREIMRRLSGGLR